MEPIIYVLYILQLTCKISVTINVKVNLINHKHIRITHLDNETISLSLTNNTLCSILCTLDCRLVCVENYTAHHTIIENPEKLGGVWKA